MAISHLTYIKDASGLAQAKGLPSLIYHEPPIEVKFMRGAAGTTRILTMRGLCVAQSTSTSKCRESVSRNNPVLDQQELRRLRV